jgi:hypothetical protein
MFVKLARKVAVHNDRDVVDVILIHPKGLTELDCQQRYRIFRSLPISDRLCNLSSLIKLLGSVVSTIGVTLSRIGWKDDQE